MEKLINDEVSKLHFSHYEKSPNGLINKEMSPNSNTIYHLYSNGEITSQKGSWAYSQRSEFTEYQALFLTRRFEFPIKLNNGLSFAILTKDECVMIRNKMNQ